MNPRYWTILLIVFSLAASIPGQAQNIPTTAAIEARLIQAGSGEEEKIDPELKDITDKLKKSFNYNQYQLVERKTAYIQRGKIDKITFTGDLVLEITLQGLEKNKAILKLRWTRRFPDKDPQVLVKSSIRLRLDGGPILYGEEKTGLILALKAK
jgi:hypothetical protein